MNPPRGNHAERRNREVPTAAKGLDILDDRPHLRLEFEHCVSAHHTGDHPRGAPRLSNLKYS